MYVQRVAELRAGDVLAESVHDEAGRVLLRGGVVLDRPLIERLRARGLAAVRLRDGLADDLPPSNIVSVQVRSRLADSVRRVFELSSVAGIAATHGPGGGPRTVDEACSRISTMRLDESVLETMFAAVTDLIDEVLHADHLGSLESLKSHSDYTFQHSVDVAILSVLLGRRAGLSDDQMRNLAVGALLHDIGKIFIDVAILDKPGPLTDEERAQINEHPEMGYHLIKQMPVGSLVPPHVAWQHHERQDGGGYPRGLDGLNRIERAAASRLDGRRMLLIAEIAAVADVHSAISSDRPYRPAMPPDEVLRVLLGMAGSHLNAEVVRLLSSTITPYPVGTWVQVTSGARAGCRGVVSQIDPTRPDRPIVRVLVDERGEAFSNPFEIDLGRNPTVGVRGLPRSVHPAGPPPTPSRRARATAGAASS